MENCRVELEYHVWIFRYRDEITNINLWYTHDQIVSWLIWTSPETCWHSCVVLIECLDIVILSFKKSGGDGINKCHCIRTAWSVIWFENVAYKTICFACFKCKWKLWLLEYNLSGSNETPKTTKGSTSYYIYSLTAYQDFSQDFIHQICDGQIRESDSL